MIRRFINAMPAGTARVLLVAALALPAAVGVAGCSTFVPQTTTLTGAAATDETVAAPLDTFEFQLDPAAVDDPLATWARVSQRLGFDPAAARPFGIDFDFAASGSLQWFFVQGITGDGRDVRVVQGAPAGMDRAAGAVFVETTPTTAPEGMVPLPVSVDSVLWMLKTVGVGNIFAKLPPAGEGGHYGLALLDLATIIRVEGSAPQQPAYVWDGTSFQTADPQDGKYADPGRYLCFNCGSSTYSPTTTEAPPPEIFMYMTTTHFISAGLALFFIPLSAEGPVG